MKESLCFDWRFQEGFKEESISEGLKDYRSVDIPFCAKEVPCSCFDEKEYQGIYSFEKIFDVTFHSEKRYFLQFEGFMLQADIYLNGTYLGHYISGWKKVEIEIGKYLKSGKNRLLLKLDSREDDKIPPFGKAVDYLTFAGIYRPVFLLEREEEFIRHVSVLQADKECLSLRCDIQGQGKPAFSLYDREGKLIKEFIEEKTKIDDVHLWSLSDPYLYTLVVKYRNDQIRIPIGFRKIQISQEGFFLNGERIKLIGLNRHQNYPYVGPALPKGAQREDADILKYQLGCNIVRTSHYPQSEDFLNRCDEIGLLVQTEVPGWQHISKDEEWRKTFLNFIEEMVLKEQNHPSLIFYGIRVDESVDDDELYSKANEICHHLDPNRATTGVRNFKTSHCLEDYYCYNDFSCSSLSHGLDDPKSIKGAKGKAVLISENNGHMFPTKMYDTTERRIEHSLRHLKVMDDALKYDGLLGEIGWCAFDYNTHKDFGSGDRICYHGLCDIYRNLKDAGYAYQSQNCQKAMLHVCNIPVSGDNDEANNKPFVVFTNCDSVKMFKNGKFIKEFFPDRKNYPSLLHPPVFIDDFIGNSFSEGMSDKDSAVITKALNYIARVGYSHIKYSKLIPALLVLKKHHLPIQTAFDWYYKYVSGWGEMVNSYLLIGQIDGKDVIDQRLEPATSFHYEIKANKTKLINEETYDVSLVSITFVDQNRLQQHYSFKPISVETEGPIEVIGPKMLSLVGGDISIYVRSKKVAKQCDATLIIHTDLGDEKVEFTVE